MKFLIMLAIAMSFVACGSDDAADEDSQTGPEREPTIGKEIADEYNEALDRANDVETQIMQQKADIDAALEEAENEP